MNGLRLNRHGIPVLPEVVLPSGLPVSIQSNVDGGWLVNGVNGDAGSMPAALDAAMRRAPAHITDMLERAESEAGRRDMIRMGASFLSPPSAVYERRMSMQSWEELIYGTVATAKQISNTT